MIDKPKKRILIVDDDATDRMMLRMLVLRLPDSPYVCVEAQDCAQALELCRQETPDCILLDYQMPDMDGIIFFKKLRHAGLQHVPVILITAFGSESLAVHAFRTGVQDYLRKDRLTTDTLCHAIKFSIYKKQAENALLQCEVDMKNREQELNILQRMVSHDLQSPLATIETFVACLEKDIAGHSTSSIEKDLLHVRTAVAEMKNLITGVLNGVQSPQVDRGALSLQELAEDAVNHVASQIVQRNLRMQITDKPVMLNGDRAELVCLLQNLIDNAVKFMGDQAEPLIEIGAETVDGETVLYVRDNGCGVEPHGSENLFDMFERGGSAADGSGIGLALVKKIVESHGGRIWVESDGLGKGACFKFTLPVKSSEQ